MTCVRAPVPCLKQVGDCRTRTTTVLASHPNRAVGPQPRGTLASHCIRIADQGLSDGAMPQYVCVHLQTTWAGGSGEATTAPTPLPLPGPCPGLSSSVLINPPPLPCMLLLAHDLPYMCASGPLEVHASMWRLALAPTL